MSGVGFGFLGAGHIARSALAPAVHAADGAHLQAVAARDSDRAAALEPAGATYDDYAALLEDPAVDVVYVALNNDAHARWATAALEAGKHVLCEKPLGLDLAQVQQMQAAALAADRLLVEAWWYRWHPRTMRAAELVAAGELGSVSRMEAAFCYDGDFAADDAGSFRLDAARGGGAVYDVGCYTVDAACWALPGSTLSLAEAGGRHLDTTGDRVDIQARVRAIATVADRTATVADRTATVADRTTTDSGGTEAVVDLRCAIRGEDDQLVAVHGSTATLVLGGESFSNRDRASTLYLVPAGGRTEAVREQFAPVDPYTLMVQAVAARVRGEDAWLPGPEHSVRVATFTDAWRAALAGTS